MRNNPQCSIGAVFRRAVCIAGTLGAVLILQAQQTPAPANQEPTQMEKVVVTGSYIPTAENVGVAPVQTVTPVEIEQTGSADILFSLKKLNPGLTGGANLVGSVNNNWGIGGGLPAGESYISLNNLPTLVLIDGRRVAASALSSGQAVDINTIPVSMVERVEILQDGASVQYGSDAIGGVVNVITKKNFSGVEVGGRYAFTPEQESSEYRQYQAYFVAGTSTDNAKFVVGAQYYFNTPLLTLDRPTASASIADLASIGIVPPSYFSPSYPGRVESGTKYILAGSPFAQGTVNVPSGTGGFYNYLPNLTTPPRLPGTGGTNVYTTVGAYNAAAYAQLGYYPYIPLAVTPFGTNVNALNTGGTYPGLNTTQFGTYSYLQQDRRNLWANFEHDIFGKEMQFFGSFLYANDLSQAALAPSPVPYLGPYNIAVQADDPNNPFGIALGLNGAGTPRVRSRFVDSGNRVFNASTDNYRFVGGLKGEFSTDYNYDVAYTYNRVNQSYMTENAINGAALNQALTPNPAAGPGMSMLTDPGGNYLPLYNMFSLGGNDPTTVEQMRTTLYQTGVSELWSVDGVLSGRPIDLPAGKLGFAVGFQYLFQGVSLNADGLTKQGLVPGLNQAFPFPGGQQDQTSLFAEFQIPIFSPEMNIPALYSFEITPAVRWTEINPGGQATVPKVGVRWQPIDNQVTLRGTYSQGYIAPSIYSLFGPPSMSNPSMVLPDPTTYDPALGHATAVQSGQVQTTTYSNPNLEPATSEQFTGGIVYSPKEVEGLTVSADYYNVTVQNLVFADPVGAAQSLNQFGSASPFASGFMFADGSRLTTTRRDQVGIDNFGTLSLYNQGSAALKTDGLNMSASYTRPIESLQSKVTLMVNANYTFNYEFQNAPNLPYYDYVGFATYGFGGAQGLIPPFNLNCSLTWEYKNLTYYVGAHYIPSVVDDGFLFPSVVDPTGPYQGYTINNEAWTIPSYFTVDMQLSYEFGKTKTVKSWYDGLKLTVGCNNIANRAPEYVPSGPEDNTDKNVYDLLGRLLYFEVSMKF
jgi:iron complex outermembrane recepter protein